MYTIHPPCRAPHGDGGRTDGAPCLMRLEKDLQASVMELMAVVYGQVLRMG